MALRIFKMIATSGLQRSPDPLPGLRGPTSKREENRKRRKGDKKGRGREREGSAPFRKFLDPPLIPDDVVLSTV